MARTYKRDSRGRFAGGGGPSSGGSAPAKVGRSGPRGGKTGTRAEQRRAAKDQAARSAAFRGKAAMGRDARAAYRSAAGAARAAGRKGGALARRDPAGAIVPTRQAVRVSATPAAGRKPRIADALRSTLRELAQSDARFYRDLEQLVGPIKVPKPKPARSSSASGSAAGGSQRGSVTQALRGTLRDLARADAARLREIADITRQGTAGAISGSKGSRRRVSGSGASKALPGGTSSKPKPKRKR